MKILHTIQGFSQRMGGVSSCVAELMQALNACGHRTDILALRSPLANDDEVCHSDLIHILENDSKLPIGYSRNFHSALRQYENFDLWHTNGMWMDVNFYTIYRAWRLGIPSVLSPHGMLYPQALRQGWLKKKIFLELFYRFLLEHVFCIHVTCREELEHYRKLGFCNPAAIIPNPLRIPPFLPKICVRRHSARVGYLGRFHPRKNIERLIELRRSKRLPADLYLIGGGSAEYEAALRKLAANDSGIVFTGFLNGKEKFEMLASLTVLCVPSDFENFGMIIPEALISGTPVVASRGTPWKDLECYGCGRWVENDTDSLADALSEILSASPERRRDMGEQGKKLVREKYEATIVGQQMASLYHWILHRDTIPDFVDIVHT